jgi:hypothetical protein
MNVGKPKKSAPGLVMEVSGSGCNAGATDSSCRGVRSTKAAVMTRGDAEPLVSSRPGKDSDFGMAKTSIGKRLGKIDADDKPAKPNS